MGALAGIAASLEELSDLQGRSVKLEVCGCSRSHRDSWSYILRSRIFLENAKNIDSIDQEQLLHVKVRILGT